MLDGGIENGISATYYEPVVYKPFAWNSVEEMHAFNHLQSPCPLEDEL